MSDSLLPALQYSVSIVDSQGRPTLWFQQQWNKSLADRIGPIGQEPSPSLPSVAQQTSTNTQDVSSLKTEISSFTLAPPVRPLPKPDGPDARLQRLEAMFLRLQRRVDALEQGHR